MVHLWLDVFHLEKINLCPWSLWAAFSNQHSSSHRLDLILTQRPHPSLTACSPCLPCWNSLDLDVGLGFSKFHDTCNLFTCQAGYLKTLKQGQLSVLGKEGMEKELRGLILRPWLWHEYELMGPGRGAAHTCRVGPKHWSLHSLHQHSKTQVALLSALSETQFFQNIGRQERIWILSTLLPRTHGKFLDWMKIKCFPYLEFPVWSR